MLTAHECRRASVLRQREEGRLFLLPRDKARYHDKESWWSLRQREVCGSPSGLGLLILVIKRRKRGYVCPYPLKLGCLGDIQDLQTTE